MKIQIDTEKKTILIEEQIQVRKLLSFLEFMLPNAKDYVLIPRVITVWNNPIIIRNHQPWWENPWWYEYKYDNSGIGSDMVYYSDVNVTSDNKMKLESFTGTYNVEL